MNVVWKWVLNTSDRNVRFHESWKTYLALKQKLEMQAPEHRMQWNTVDSGTARSSRGACDLWSFTPSLEPHLRYGGWYCFSSWPIILFIARPVLKYSAFPRLSQQSFHSTLYTSYQCMRNSIQNTEKKLQYSPQFHDSHMRCSDTVKWGYVGGNTCGSATTRGKKGGGGGE